MESRIEQIYNGKRMMVVGYSEQMEIIPVWYPENLDEKMRAVLPTMQVSGIRMEDAEGITHLSFNKGEIDRKVQEYVEIKRHIVGEAAHTDWIPVVSGISLFQQVRVIEQTDGYEFQEMISAARTLENE